MHTQKYKYAIWFVDVEFDTSDNSVTFLYVLSVVKCTYSKPSGSILIGYLETCDGKLRQRIQCNENNNLSCCHYFIRCITYSLQPEDVVETTKFAQLILSIFKTESLKRNWDTNVNLSISQLLDN